jgi:hypothetical protein
VTAVDLAKVLATALATGLSCFPCGATKRRGCPHGHRDPQPIPGGAGAVAAEARPLVSTHRRGIWARRTRHRRASSPKAAAWELETFKDGKSRKITVASIKAYIARKIEASRRQHAA